MGNSLCVLTVKPTDQIVTEITRVDFKTNTDTPSVKFYADEEVKASEESRASFLDNCKYGPVAKAVNCGSYTRFCLGDISIDEFPEGTVVERHSNILRSESGGEEISEEKIEMPFITQRLKVKNMDKLETAKTSPKLKAITRSISPARIYRPSAFLKKSSILSLHTLLSDWGSLFDLESPDAIKSDGFPTQTELGFSSTLSGIYTKRASRLSAAISSKSILLLPGKVLAMFMLKEDWQFQILDLDTSLEEVVNKFLVKESGVRLPLCFSRPGDSSSKNISLNRMESTLAANLGKDFDAQSQGLVFAAGAVNSKLCYKMSVCPLRELQKIVSFLSPENLPYK